MELIAACVALETMGEGYVMTIYSDFSYLINCMSRGWHKKWRENGWFNHLRRPVANKDLWERLLKASQRHREVRWRKVKGHAKTAGPHKGGNDRADELAVAAKREAEGDPGTAGCLCPEGREVPSIAGQARDDEGDRASRRREGAG